MIRKTAIPLAVLCLVSGCSTYQYAKNVKLVSFENDVTEGKSVGPVRGEICQGFVMGRPIGEGATLDRAMAQARAKNKLRYINNVATETSGFDAVFYARRCLSVRGTGYE
jgi:hypothetical protein